MLQTKKRIEYIDALRGFTMILVVLSHVAHINLGVDVSNNDNFHYYFQQFRMPLFFFVSGFLLYKANFKWNLENTKFFLYKKSIVQIISPFIFFLCYINYRQFPFIESLLDSSKMGYWFTFVLFNYFILYISFRVIFDMLKLKEKTVFSLLLVIGLSLYYFPLYSFLQIIGVNENILGFFCLIKMNYFIFFIFGLFIKKYFEKFENYLNSSLLLVFVIIVYFILNIFVDITCTDLICNILSKSKRIILAFCGIIIVFSFFRHNENYFSNKNKISNILKYIGKRTLDIYLLHYFFLSFNLPEIFPFFAKYNLPIIEFTMSLAMTALVISACLIISSVLRLNNTMAHFLFGAKKN